MATTRSLFIFVLVLKNHFQDWAMGNPDRESYKQESETTDCWWSWPVVFHEHIDADDNDTKDEYFL